MEVLHYCFKVSISHLVITVVLLTEFEIDLTPADLTYIERKFLFGLKRRACIIFTFLTVYRSHTLSFYDGIDDNASTLFSFNVVQV